MGHSRPIARLPTSRCGRSGATLNHGGNPHTPLLGYRMDSAGRRVCASSAFGCGRSRATFNHGAKPHTPRIDDNGFVREENLCGRHRLCQHALTDKLIASGVCRNNKFYHPVIRAPPSARGASHGARSRCVRRAENMRAFAL